MGPGHAKVAVECPWAKKLWREGTVIVRIFHAFPHYEGTRYLKNVGKCLKDMCPYGPGEITIQLTLAVGLAVARLS